MATDKTDDFQQQAREMLRAQQDAYVAAVKAWREALATGESSTAQPPPPGADAAADAAHANGDGRSLLRVRGQAARGSEPIHGSTQSGHGDPDEEILTMR